MRASRAREGGFFFLSGTHRGRETGRRCSLSSQTDVVLADPSEWSFLRSGEMRDGEIWGRGALGTLKGQVAASAVAIAHSREQGFEAARRSDLRSDSR